MIYEKVKRFFFLIETLDGLAFDNFLKSIIKLSYILKCRMKKKRTIPITVSIANF
jgi:hypothetical protein